MTYRLSLISADYSHTDYTIHRVQIATEDGALYLDTKECLIELHENAQPGTNYGDCPTFKTGEEIPYPAKSRAILAALNRPDHTAALVEIARLVAFLRDDLNGHLSNQLVHKAFNVAAKISGIVSKALSK